MRARLAAGMAALSLSLGLTGCSALSGGAYDVTLPGGADVGDSPWTLTAQFTDVLDLVPQSAVKVDDVAIGRVARIRLAPDGRTAQVTMTVRDGLRLPVGTTARLQQTSLLGEKYVALVRPGEGEDDLGRQQEPDDGAGTGGAVPAAASSATSATSATSDGTGGAGGYLQDGATIPIADTSQAVGVEQVLGALSLLLTGGGLGQFQEISRELQQVSSGRPEEIRAFLEQTRVLVSSLDERRGSITDAIDGLATLSQTLKGEQPKINRALDGLEPGLAVLRDQRGQLVKMLESLDELSTVSVRTLDRAQDDIVADLKRIRPILRRLSDAGDALPQALQVLFTYPFPDSVLRAIRGDYLNVFATMNLATPGETISQPVDRNDVSASASPSTGARGLMLLPPTSSAVPGLDEPTVSLSPSGSSSPSPSTPSKSPSKSPSGKATQQDPATTSPPSTTGTGGASQPPSSSGTPSTSQSPADESSAPTGPSGSPGAGSSDQSGAP